jgi:hypothetical protein
VFDWPPDGRHALKVERYELPAPDDSLEVQPPPDAAVVQPAAAPPAVATPPEPARSAPPAPAPAPEPRLHMAPSPAVDAPRPAASPRPVPASVTAPSTRRIPGVAIGLAVVVLAGLIWILVGRRGETPRPPPAEPVMDPVAPAQSPPAASTPRPAPPARSAAGGELTIGEASLCTSFVNYRCVPAASPVRAGQLTFYTRLVATRDTAVVHRWYRGDQLRQAVRLSVPARTKGFRTFSRGTVYASGGDWRVELRTLDGRLLHTQTFTVR